jgi:hypothetical protein
MTNQLKIEVGDTVRISDKSGHYGCGSSNPMSEGISIAPKDEDWPYRVLWPDGQTNSYKSHDLILIKKGKTMQFTKSDLKTGMFVKYRRGDYRMVLENILTGDCWMGLDELRDDLSEDNTSIGKLDVMSVYIADSNSTISEYLKGEYLTLIWERTEQTPAQKEMEVLQAKMDELQEQMKVVQAKL